MKLIKGFTLIELLVAVGIIAVLSVLSTQLLFNTVTSRAKQQSIAESSTAFRSITQTLATSIMEAKKVSVPDISTLKITANTCKTYHYNTTNKSLEVAEDINPSCIPPTSGFIRINNPDIEITKLEFTPVVSLSEKVNIVIEGESKNSLGSHPFSFSTTVVPRVKL
jgi:prepilin-type N-terminal cleavage/methylation domain-containing protein